MRRSDLPTLFLATVLALIVCASIHARDDDRIVAVTNARIITGAGQTIESGTIVIVNGKIEAVGANVEYPPSAERIDAKGQTVMPGLVHPGTRANLPRYSRNGVNAQRIAADEVYLSELDLSSYLEAGYVAVAVQPVGNGLPGQASLYLTAGPDESRLIDRSFYVLAPFSSPGRDKSSLREAFKRAKSELEKINKAREEWDKKQQEAQQQQQRQQQQQGEQKEPPPTPPGNRQDEPPKKEEEKPAEPPKFEPPAIAAGYEPLVDMLRDKDKATPLLLDVNNASSYVHLRDLLDEGWDDLPRIVMIEARAGDFSEVIDRVAAADSVVIASAQMTSIPMTVTEYNVPAALDRAGCTVALVPARSLTDFRTDVMELVRSGLPREAAITAMTLNVAKAFHLDDRFGSIEEGKRGDLMFLNGDALDPFATVQRVVIGGETVWTPEVKR